MAEPPSRRWSLRVTISTLLIGMLVLVVGGAVTITLVVRERSVEATAAAIQHEVSKSVAAKLTERLSPAEGILQATAAAIREGRLEIDDPSSLARHLAERVRYDDRFDVIGFRRPDGAVGGAQRGLAGVVRLLYAVAPEDGGSLRIHAELLRADGSREGAAGMDVSPGALSSVPWYEDGSSHEGPVWTKRYERPVGGGYGRACALGVRRDGELLGVLALGFGEQFIADYLRQLQVAETGVVIGVAADTGEIVVAPTPEVRARLGPVVTEALAQVPGGHVGLEVGRPFHTTLSRDGVDYAVSLELQVFRETVRWVSAVVIPEQELVGFLDRYLTYALVGIGVLFLVAVLLASLLATRIARPLKVVAADLARVGNFDLSSNPIPASFIEEVAVVGDSVDRMKASLRSFGRYVPTDLVRDLLAQGNEARLDGRERPLTLFFSDVKGFTSVSEGMPPQRLIDALGDYLDVVTKAVGSQQGTIDKFMGDGVLAFFNAPRDDADHVVHGCRAALETQAKLAAAREGWVNGGRPPFFTRIGLHTAEVVVGNIGTPERFSYTVLGDGVNLAARLESLNKAYGTWILASDEIQRGSGDVFEWRHVDRTAVAGRAGGTEIHELLGETGQVSEDLLRARDAYEAALQHYLDRRFGEAARAFAHAASLRPDDPAAVTLGRRAEAYAGEPPSDDWDGVFAQTQK